MVILFGQVEFLFKSLGLDELMDFLYRMKSTASVVLAVNGLKVTGVGCENVAADAGLRNSFPFPKVLLLMGHIWIVKRLWIKGDSLPFSIPIEPIVLMQLIQ